MIHVFLYPTQGEKYYSSRCLALDRETLLVALVAGQDEHGTAILANQNLGLFYGLNKFPYD